MVGNCNIHVCGCQNHQLIDHWSMTTRSAVINIGFIVCLHSISCLFIAKFYPCLHPIWYCELTWSLECMSGQICINSISDPWILVNFFIFAIISVLSQYYEKLVATALLTRDRTGLYNCRRMGISLCDFPRSSGDDDDDAEKGLSL